MQKIVLQFISIPEIPAETPDNNEVLNFALHCNDKIDFSKIDFEKCYLALGKTMGEFSSLIENLIYIDANGKFKVVFN